MTRTNASVGIAQYWAMSYLFTLANLSPLLVWSGLELYASVFQILVFMSYGALYLLPVYVLVEALRRWIVDANVILAVLAILGVGTVQTLIFADRTIFEMFDFHINGFVWNLVTTPGGIASMGADQASTLSFAAIVGLFYLSQSAAWVVSTRATR